MGSVRRHRGLFAWLALLSLLGNVLVGAFCPMGASAKSAPLTDDVLGALVLCMPDAASPAHGPGGDDPRPSPPHCPACLLLAGFALLAIVALALLTFPTTLMLEPPRALVRTLADHLSFGGIQSRAPPLSA